MIRSILVASQHMEDGSKELMGALWSTYLPATMRTLQQRMTQPIEIGVRMQIVITLAHRR